MEAENAMRNEIGVPAVVDQSTFQAELDALRVREKAHTREGDAIQPPPAAPDGRGGWRDAADRRARGRDAAGRVRGSWTAHCLLLHVAYRPLGGGAIEGCTLYTSQVRELSFLHSRDVTYATFCQGPYEESARYRDFMEWKMP